jgi:hypothetical protein
MKKIAALAATALVVIAASQLASTVGAARQSSINRRVSLLEGKVKTLQASTKALKARASALEGFAGCIVSRPTAPMSQFTGYLYSPDNGATVRLDSAVDIAGQGETPSFYAATVHPSCAPAFGSSSGASSPGTTRAKLATLKPTLPASQLSRSQLLPRK